MNKSVGPTTASSTPKTGFESNTIPLIDLVSSDDDSEAEESAVVTVPSFRSALSEKPTLKRSRTALCPCDETICHTKKQTTLAAWTEWRENRMAASSKEQRNNIPKFTWSSSGKTLRSSWPPSLGRTGPSSKRVDDTIVDQCRTPSCPFEPLVDRTGGRYLELHPCVLDRQMEFPAYPGDNEDSSMGLQTATSTPDDRSSKSEGKGIRKNRPIRD